MKLPRILSCTCCGTGPKILSMLGMTGSFMLVELIVGNYTNSMALVADSFHMLSDVIALMIAYISVRISPREWQKNTYGYARAEVVGALINAVFLFALCFSIAVESFKRFLLIEHIEDPEMIMIVGGVGLAINVFGMCLFGDSHGGHGHSHGGNDHSHGGHGHSHEKDQKKEIENKTKGCSDVKEKGGIDTGAQMNIKGVFLHVMADALGSVVVLISASVIWLTDWEYKDYLDPLLSLLIVILICISTWPLFRESIMILLNSTPAHIDTTQLKSGLMSTIPVIRNVHELHIWQLVGRFDHRFTMINTIFEVCFRRIIVTGHVEVEPTDKGFLSHEYHFLIGKQIKDYFHDLGIHSTTIQIEYSIGARRRYIHCCFHFCKR